MAVKSGFFDSVAKDRVYNSKEMTDNYGLLWGNGIVIDYGQELRPIVNGSGIMVGTGRAIIDGHWMEIDSLYTPQISFTGTVKCLLVIRLSYIDREIIPCIIKGTSTAYTTTSDSDNIKYLHICKFTYGSSITIDEILIGTSVCPYVRSSPDLQAQIDAHTLSIKNLVDNLNDKVDAEPGKGLSSNDFTDHYKELLDSGGGGSVPAKISDLVDDTETVPIAKALVADTIQQNFIMQSSEEYPLLGSADSALTQDNVTGTPYKFHGLRYAPTSGTLKVRKVEADEFTGTASKANYAANAGSADTADVSTTILNCSASDSSVIKIGYTSTSVQASNTNQVATYTTDSDGNRVIKGMSYSNLANHISSNGYGNIRPIYYSTNAPSSSLATGAVWLQYEE